MKHKTIVFSIVITLLINLCACHNAEQSSGNESMRPLKDTIGFASAPWQIDSLMARMFPGGMEKSLDLPWKMVICPHDDYTYVGRLYPDLLKDVKARNLILIGVAHKAAKMGIEDSLVFDSYKSWKGPWKNINISPVREELYNQLAGKFAIVNDSLQKVEHSVEALIPYLQYFNKDITVIPILVPAMSPERMTECGKALAEAIRKVANDHKWEWGKDYAIVSTTDAVHYGNEDWGGADMAFFGCDDSGNAKAMQHESVIIDSCLKGSVNPDKIRLFSKYTLNASDFHKYKWTWCGRYSVPLALYTTYYLDDSHQISGSLTGYSTSITSTHIPVDDLRMGRTAIATKCHWVGYAALGYR